MSLAHLPPNIAHRRVIGTADAAELCGLSVSTFRRMRDTRSIPVPIRLSERKLGWRIGDLLAWLDAREAGLDWHTYQAALAGNDNRRND